MEESQSPDLSWLLTCQSNYRDEIYAVLSKFPVEILRKRVSPNKWSIEELLRHNIQVYEWWFKALILGQEHPELHPIGVDGGTQCSQWYSLEEIKAVMHALEQDIIEYLQKRPDPEKLCQQPGRNYKTTLKWIIWHLIQHENETDGMLAERIRTYGYPTPWEF